MTPDSRGYARCVAKGFAEDDRVIVRESERTAQEGTAGRRGRIAGTSREPDVPTGEVVAYAVAMDDDGRVWMVDPDDVLPA